MSPSTSYFFPFSFCPSVGGTLLLPLRPGFRLLWWDARGPPAVPETGPPAVPACVRLPLTALFLRVPKRENEFDVFCWVVARFERRKGLLERPVVVVVPAVFLCEKRPMKVVDEDGAGRT